MGEGSALGVAQLAGVSAGLWSDLEARSWPTTMDTFEPIMSQKDAAALRTRWSDAVAATRTSIHTTEEPT
jgi:glycerol kinase